jgi:hypothetical protein
MTLTQNLIKRIFKELKQFPFLYEQGKESSRDSARRKRKAKILPTHYKNSGQKCDASPHFHSIVLPVITPSQTARNPTVTLRMTYRSPKKRSPLLILRKASSSNVEKVV